MSPCSAAPRLLLHLLLVSLLVASTCAAASSSATEDAQYLSPKMARIQRHLDRLNKPALRTIQVLRSFISLHVVPFPIGYH
jgi:hypothetical protein